MLHPRMAFTARCAAFLILVAGCQAALTLPARAAALQLEEFRRLERAGTEGILPLRQHVIGLGEREFLSLMDDISRQHPVAENMGALPGWFQLRWRGLPPVGLLQREMADKGRSPGFRRAAAGFLGHALKRLVREGSEPAFVLETRVASAINSFRALAADRAQGAAVRAQALAELSTLLGVSPTPPLEPGAIERHGDFLIGVLADRSDDEIVRAYAARALRVLDDRRALPHLRGLVGNPAVGSPLLTRASLLALAKMGDREAVGLISRQLEATSSEEVFRTAFYALGLYEDPALLGRMVKVSRRFGGLAARALLVHHRDLVSRGLASPDGAVRRDAVEAAGLARLTGEKERVLALGRDADPAVRKAAFRALPALGGEEDWRVAAQRAGGERDPEIAAAVEELRLLGNRVRIEATRSAMPSPRAAHFPCGSHGGDPCDDPHPPGDYRGNLLHLELGDAVYRTLCLVDNYLWPDSAEYDHAALYIGNQWDASAGQYQELVLQAAGELAPCVVSGSFEGITSQPPPEEWWGAYQVATVDTAEERQGIVSTAFAMASDSDIGYWPLDCIDYKGFTWERTVDDIDDTRCDGVTEFCYEKNGHWAWGKDGANYDITASTANCDEHNDAPDLSIEPSIEASPKAQRGGFGNTNTQMRPAVAASPVVTPYVLSGSPGRLGYYLSDVQLQLEAADVSGVMSVTYSLESTGETDYVRRSSQAIFALTGSDMVSYFATDFAGNYPAFRDWFQVRIDKSPPTVAITSPAGNPAQATAASVTLSGTATDAGSGLYRVEAWSATAGPENYVFANEVPGPPSGSWSIASFPVRAGLNTIHARAWDLAGNPSAEAVVEVNLVPKRLSVVAAPADGATISVFPADVYGNSSGTTSFNRFYTGGTVTLQAPASYGGNGFLRWERDGVSLGSGVNPVDVAMGADHLLVARYGDAYPAPARPDGPASGWTGVTYTYSTVGAKAAGHEAHGIEYQYDWNTAQGGSGVWGSATQDYSWGVGTKQIWVRSRCAADPSVISPWSQPLTAVISLESVTQTGPPAGATNGVVGVAYVFTGSGATNTGDELEYQFDWGSGPSGVWGIAAQSHTWATPGDFAVKYQARCKAHTSFTSGWSSASGIHVETETLVGSPATPRGQQTVTTGTEYDYRASGVASSLGHELEHEFFFGDQHTPWGPAVQSHAWRDFGIYPVTVRTRCKAHPIAALTSAWSPALEVSVGKEEIGNPEVPMGQTAGVSGTRYLYTTSALGMPDHPLVFRFDWGDGAVSEWGEETQGHEWLYGLAGTRLVRAQAMCKDHEATSGWSDPLTVVIAHETISMPVPVPNVSPQTAVLDHTFTMTHDAVSNAGHPVEYRFRWEGTAGTWGPATQGHVFAYWNGSPYDTLVTARARCATHNGLESFESAGVVIHVVKETVDRPGAPTGASAEYTGEQSPYTGLTSGYAGHPLEYEFDWGGGPSGAWGAPTQLHAWSVAGTYQVKVRARCALLHTAVSPWSPARSVVVAKNPERISTPAAPAGKTIVFAGAASPYTGAARSSLGHALEYEFDWGGGPTGVWGPAGQTHSWTAPGTYPVRVRARCAGYRLLRSAWSAARTVEVHAPGSLLFSDHFSHAAGTVDPHWVVTAGGWSVTSDKRYASRANALDRALVRNEAPGTGTRTFGAGRIDLTFKMTATGAKAPQAQVLFSRVAAGFRYVRITGTQILIGQVGRLGGQGASVLAVNHAFRTGVWYRLLVDVGGSGLVRVRLGSPGTQIASKKFLVGLPGAIGLQADHARSLFDNVRFWK